MAAILEDTTGATFALSPEQRAVAAMLPAETAAAGATLALLVLLADIEGALDAPRLKAAVQAVLQAHGALRCAVLQVPGFRGLRQRTRDAMPPLRWQALDLRDSADSAAVFADWFAAFANEPLDVADGVQVRAGLVRLGETRHRLALAASAFAADAGSLHTLFAQIAAAHAAVQVLASTRNSWNGARTWTAATKRRKAARTGAATSAMRQRCRRRAWTCGARALPRRRHLHFYLRAFRARSASTVSSPPGCATPPPPRTSRWRHCCRPRGGRSLRG
jgi:hypothetical protein